MARFEAVSLPDRSPAEPGVISRAVAVLDAGGILAHPTATVYGLGGAAQADVDAAIGELKGRSPSTHAPLLRVFDSVTTLHRVLRDLTWDERADRLAARFWPGPLTLVLPDRTAGGVAVRVEAHAGLGDVLAAWARPMTSTSLNRSGEPAASSAARARRTLTNMPEVAREILLLDSGDLPGPPPSTLVSLLSGEASVLRAGAIEESRIRECLEEQARP
jgi:L-threonylcarbamoyladenylate synthase